MPENKQESDQFIFIVVFTGQRTQAPQPYSTFTYYCESVWVMVLGCNSREQSFCWPHGGVRAEVRSWPVKILNTHLRQNREDRIQTESVQNGCCNGDPQGDTTQLYGSPCRDETPPQINTIICPRQGLMFFYVDPHHTCLAGPSQQWLNLNESKKGLLHRLQSTYKSLFLRCNLSGVYRASAPWQVSRYLF